MSIGGIGTVLLLLLALPGCASGPSEAEIKTVADLEMRAIALREKRFALANEIRFTQDTLLRTDSTDPQAIRLRATLEDLAVKKDSFLNASLVLADTIKHHIDSIADPERYSREELAEFSERLNAEIKRRSAETSGS